MGIFVQRAKRSRPAPAMKYLSPHWAHNGQTRELRSILHLQRSARNQAAPQPMATNWQHSAGRHGSPYPKITTAPTAAASPNGAIQRKIQITGLTAAKRKNFLAKINKGSVLKFKMDASGFLQQKHPKKTSKEPYSAELVKAIADAQTVKLNLITKSDTKFIDSFATGEVDYDDMKSLPYNMFRIWLLHFVVERFAVANYEANKATASSATFATAHKKGHEAQERQMKLWFPKKTIKYKSEGFDAKSKVVDKSGNGSINYVFDFTGAKLIFKQPIVANVTKENIISSKIVLV